MLLTLRKSGTTRFVFRFIEIGLLVLLFSIVLVSASFAQESTPHQMQAVAPLAELLREAEKNNPQIQAARQGWQAAKQILTSLNAS